MGRFSDVLLTVDFDRTLTATDTSIPERNLEAIRYFMAEGGTFTVNTGRSLAMSRCFLDKVPMNAPVLLYNGGAAYDMKKGQFLFAHEIPLPQGPTLRRLGAICRDQIMEVQGVDAHYIFSRNKAWEEYIAFTGLRGITADMDEDLGPLLKICIFDGKIQKTVDSLFHGKADEIAEMDRVEAALRSELGDHATVLRVAPRTIDIVAPGVSKGGAARQLQAALGKKILVCVGDEQNDISMLDMADYSFCPAGSAVSDRYPNVCTCNEGAVADVIYKKIPGILEQCP